MVGQGQNLVLSNEILCAALRCKHIETKKAIREYLILAGPARHGRPVGHGRQRFCRPCLTRRHRLPCEANNAPPVRAPSPPHASGPCPVPSRSPSCNGPAGRALLLAGAGARCMLSVAAPLATLSWRHVPSLPASSAIGGASRQGHVICGTGFSQYKATPITLTLSSRPVRV